LIPASRTSLIAGSGCTLTVCIKRLDVPAVRRSATS
jgi:hypothetical protein